MSRDVITVGSKMKISLLYRGEYSQWREREMRGSEYGEQDRKAAILYEYETFKAIEGEQLLDTYLRYLQKQYGTLMRQTKNLIDINIDALYNILKKNQGDVNDALGYKKKVFVVTSDTLALVAEKTNVSKRKEKVIVSSDSEEVVQMILSANKKQEFVKSDEKKEDKKSDEKRRDMSKVKIGFENPSYFEKAKDLRPTLYDKKVIGQGYTPMFLTHSNEALEIEKFKRSRENKIEFAYEYGNLNASYVNEKINFLDDYFQEIINPYFEKIDSPFQQTSSLKPYVLNVILEKIIIDLEDEVVEKECDKVENPKVIAPGMFKLSVSQSVSPISMTKTSCKSNNVEYVKRYSCKDLLSCNNSHLGETSSASVCNNAMNVSCISRMCDLLDDNNFFIFDDESVKISPVSKMPFRKKPHDFINIVQICLWIIDSGCSKHMTGNRALLKNFVEKFLGTVRFGNNDFAMIAGYGDVVIGSMTIKKVYYKTLVNLHLQVQRVRTDNGTEFKNKTLAKFFDEDVGKLKAKGDIGVFFGYSKESTAFRIYNKRTHKIHESMNVNFDNILEKASKQFSLEPGLSNLNKMGKSSNPSVSQVSESSRKDLEDLFHNFYDEYFDSSKIMKSSTTNVETSNAEIPSHGEEVFHKVIGLGYTPMFLTHSDEALEIEKFKRSRENKIEFAYDYGNLNASYLNEKINFEDDYFQEIINPDFEKIDSPFQQTSSLKPYVPNVILENIIIDLEDEVVNLLEKEKVNLETIESLKSKSFESSEKVCSASENQTENDCLVVEKECDKEVHRDVIWKKKVSSNTSNVGVSDVIV
nr:integrase, catalytic region, zinc finger, CCHC-type, peptidase aspartic, catalytic [Tanacetum cinerariifolium]